MQAKLLEKFGSEEALKEWRRQNLKKAREKYKKMWEQLNEKPL